MVNRIDIYASRSIILVFFFSGPFLFLICLEDISSYCRWQLLYKSMVAGVGLLMLQRGCQRRGLDLIRKRVDRLNFMPNIARLRLSRLIQFGITVFALLISVAALFDMVMILT